MPSRSRLFLWTLAVNKLPLMNPSQTRPHVKDHLSSNIVDERAKAIPNSYNHLLLRLRKHFTLYLHLPTTDYSKTQTYYAKLHPSLPNLKLPLPPHPPSPNILPPKRYPQRPTMPHLPHFLRRPALHLRTPRLPARRARIRVPDPQRRRLPPHFRAPLSRATCSWRRAVEPHVPGV